jgi:NAD(P)-dependent dehydrogenase (short-subunit alcohol dehydrogenase family)
LTRRRPRPRRHPRQLHPARDIPSELRGSTDDEERSRFETGLHVGRQALSAVGQGSDIAEAVAWLAGDGGRWVTGAVIDVDGGLPLSLRDGL